MTTEEILARLHPALEQEGVAVEVIREEGENLHLRARRSGAGVPVAFLVKAIAGTFRRYHASVRDVVLDEYDPGEGIATPTSISPEFEKVLKHRPQSALQLSPEHWMGLDLRGCDRAAAVRALENAHRIWTSQGCERFLVRGLDEDAPARAFDKWRAHYGAVSSVHPDAFGNLVVHLSEDCQHFDCLGGREPLWMPAKILLVEGQ